MLNSSSMVETFIVSIRRSRQRYCAKATANAALKLKPYMLARMLEAVVIYDWEMAASGPSASLPSRY